VNALWRRRLDEIRACDAVKARGLGIASTSTSTSLSTARTSLCLPATSPSPQRTTHNSNMQDDKALRVHLPLEEGLRQVRGHGVVCARCPARHDQMHLYALRHAGLAVH